jgi:hypothetical protein
VIELVLPEGEEPFFGKWVDLHMLVMPGARERTVGEYGPCQSDSARFGFARGQLAANFDDMLVLCSSTTALD